MADSDSILTRRCCRCGETKLLTEFNSGRRKAASKSWYCKPCDSQRWRDKPELAQQRRDQRVRRSRTYYQQCPKKYLARQKAKYALKTGRIVRRACEVCQSIETLEMHHEDYDKPLDVRWLCRKHHVELHWKHAAALVQP